MFKTIENVCFALSCNIILRQTTTVVRSHAVPLFFLCKKDIQLSAWQTITPHAWLTEYKSSSETKKKVLC